MALDNSIPVAAFCPKEDGDSFIYTELLDRSKQKGNNSNRRFKAYYHRSADEFWEQWPDIKNVCDQLQIRAYTRLQRRSFKKVGKEFVKAVVEAGLTDNFAGMKTLYAHVCGTVPPVEKLWLFDVDVIKDSTKQFGKRLEEEGHLIATIPSRKGLHYISKPFDTRQIEWWCHEFAIYADEMTTHKDNPTNLYIPDGAA